MSDVKEYDFVVYGATGFTGKLVVEYLVETNREEWCPDRRSREGPSLAPSNIDRGGDCTPDKTTFLFQTGT